MRASIAKKICSLSIAVACVASLSACSESTGGVAATVNGVEILEDDVTASIEASRSLLGLDSDDDWGTYLVTYGYTPESIRELTIESFVQQELIRQAADENDVTIDSEIIDAYVELVRANYDSDEDWETALESIGTTEEKYRKSIETALMSQELEELVVTVEDPTEEELIEYASSLISSYDGGKRSSHILFDASDEETAQAVLDQINAGEIDFATAAQEYSLDSSAEDGGDVGWDVLVSFVDEYQNALDELSAGEVSGLVTSDYGIHIIMCTEVFTAPDELTSTDQIPEDILEVFIETLQEDELSTAFDEWLEAYEEEAEIIINDMPDGLSYDIDLSQYEDDEEESDDTGSTDDTDSSDDTTDDSTEDSTEDSISSDSSDTEESVDTESSDTDTSSENSSEDINEITE